ncbi:Ser/Thr protein phosphatase family protein [Lachnospiraceae bacterium KM106-2]|nr:Ser/Thr protein phosphatase family protein [Lachnospiraceae bacterium KM106-2]
MKKLKQHKYIVFFLCVILLLAGINAYRNRNIYLNNFTITSKQLPAAFEDYKIIQLTDIHSIQSKKQQDMILEKVKEQKPDLIAITGDLVDLTQYSKQTEAYESGKTKMRPGEETVPLLQALVKLAPVYYVYGNHELLVEEKSQPYFKEAVIKSGVHIINNQVVRIQKGTESIVLAGIDDPEKESRNIMSNVSEKDIVKQELDQINGSLQEKEYTILLSHRPEMFSLYQKYPIDLALTGHAHGGQFRLPFVKGAFAPGQGFLPKYDAGLYQADGLKMIVGRGIGNSVIKVRIFNSPEIVTIKLKKG